MTRHLLASAALLAAMLPAAHADISVTSPSFVYNENFNTLTLSTTASAWANDGTLPGWSLFVSTGNPPPTIAGDAGGSNTGTFRSYGDAGSAERALGNTASNGTYFGSPPNNTPAGWIALALNNASGGALDGFTLIYSGEQWRNGGNTSPQSLTLEYGFGATFGTVSSWNLAGGTFNFTSPVVGASAAAVAGNSTGTVAGLGGTVLVNWNPGDTLWLRWADLNDSGNDHRLAIDDLQLSVLASAVPEPGSLALWLAGMTALGFVARRKRG